MRNLLWVFSLLFLLLGCGGRTVGDTAAPSTLAPTGSAQTDNALPPTFTPEAVEFEQPPPVTPAPTPTPDPPTAVPPNAQPDALQALIAAENRLRNLASFSHERSITVNTPAFNQTEDISCVFQSPDQAFCHAFRETIPVTGDPEVRDFEFVQRGLQLWARGNSQADWELLPSDNTNYLDSYTNQLLLSSFVTDAFIFGESAIDGVPVYEIRLTLEPLAAVEALYSGDDFDDFLAQAQAGQAMATVWIGQADQQLRLLTIEIGFETALGTVNLSGLGSIANFNEPTIIPEP